ncbi:MAG: class I SAM-dependent methyltransferase [Thermoplasmata archaeon]
MKRVRPADMTEMYALRADTIDYFFPDRKDEIQSWAKLASEYGDEVLHLMCGTGEILVGLAEKGFDVTGIDLTQSMIYRAQEKFEEASLEKDKLIVEDARYFKLGRTFDFVFISTGDFHHFLEQDDINSALGKIYAHLRPGGGMALELFDPPTEDFKRPEKRHIPIRDTPKGLKVWKLNRSSYHADSQILDIVEKLHVDEEGVITEGEYDIQLKLYTREQMDHLLKKSGFENIRHLSNEDLEGKGHDSWIVVAER